MKYFSQDGVIKLAPRAGIALEESLSPAEKLKVVQKLMEEGSEAAAKVYESIGVYLGHTMVSLMARSYFFSSGRLAAAMDWPTRRNFSSGSSALRDLAVSGYSSSSTFWAVVRMRSPPFPLMTRPSSSTWRQPYSS